MLKRVLAIAKVRTELVPEYIRLHDNIPQEVLDEYRKYGIIHISCFLDENDTLYIYQEYDDAYDALRVPENTPADAAWQKMVGPCADPGFVPTHPKEVFRM